MSRPGIDEEWPPPCPDCGGRRVPAGEPTVEEASASVWYGAPIVQTCRMARVCRCERCGRSYRLDLPRRYWPRPR